MKKLWEMINKQFSDEKATGVFLVTNILRWTIGTLALGIVFCIVTETRINGCIVNLMCAAIYAGIIFGLFGGIIFLMRRSS